MTKKQLTKWFKEENYSISYCGKKKVMFVHGINQQRLDSFNLPTNGIILVAD